MHKLKNTVWTIAVIVFTVPMVALVFFSLPFTGWRALTVQTGSMVPKMPIGTVVLVHKAPVNELIVGNVITYKSLDKPITITHRIVHINTVPGGFKQFITKGDANPGPDTLPVSGRQVIGVVTYNLPAFGRFVDFVRTIPGLLLLVYLPAVLLAGYEIHIMAAALTRINMEEYKARLAARQRALLERLTQKRRELYGPVMAEAASAKDHPPRPIQVIMLVLIVCAVFLAGGATYALSSRSAELTNISISVVRGTSRHCTSVQILGISFIDDDDEEDEVTLTVCSPKCPPPGSPGWTLYGDEGQSWRKDALIVRCTNFLSAVLPPQSNSWDLFRLVEGLNGRQIDTSRWQDNDDH